MVARQEHRHPTQHPILQALEQRIQVQLPIQRRKEVEQVQAAAKVMDMELLRVHLLEHQLHPEHLPHNLPHNLPHPVQAAPQAMEPVHLMVPHRVHRTVPDIPTERVIQHLIPMVPPIVSQLVTAIPIL